MAENRFVMDWVYPSLKNATYHIWLTIQNTSFISQHIDLFFLPCGSQSFLHGSMEGNDSRKSLNLVVPKLIS